MEKIIMKGPGKALPNISPPVNVMWPSNRLIPPAECDPPQHQGTVLLTDRITNVFGHRLQRLKYVCYTWKVMQTVCKQRDNNVVMFKTQ